MEEMKDAVTNYIEHIQAVAVELDVSIELVVAALTLRRLEAISSQLYNQGYHRGFEETIDERIMKPTVELRPPDPDRRWQSPATAQRLVD